VSVPRRDSFYTYVGAGLALLTWAVLAMRWAYTLPFYTADDLSWLNHARRGLASIWLTSSPFQHFRPAFGTWWWLLEQAGLESPGELSAAGVVLNLALVPAVLFAFALPLGRASAWVAGTLLLIHPARSDQLFWNSAQIDGLCLLLSLLVIGQAVRIGQFESGRPAAWIGLSVTTYLAVLSKEIASALPVVLILLPELSRSTRLRVGAASVVGVLGAISHGVLVLGGVGRDGRLLTTVVSHNWLLYPGRLVWPGSEAYRAQWAAIQQGDLTAALVWTAQFLIVVCGLCMLWRQRTQAWARISALLLLAGLWPWLVVSDDRCLGLGCLGAAVLLVKLADSAPHRRVWLSLSAPCLGLVFASLWLDGASTWRRGVLEGLALQHAIQAFHRENLGSLVIVGQADRIGRSSYVTPAEELDACSSSELVLTASNFALPRAAVARVGADIWELTPTAGALLRCSQSVLIPGASCSDDTSGVRFSRAALLGAQLVRPGCGGPLTLAHWSGVLTVLP
jgi:hypothetical protein